MGEEQNRNHQTILHPPDRETLHGYAPCKRHFLHHSRRKDAGRLAGGKPQLQRGHCPAGDAFCQAEVRKSRQAAGLPLYHIL